jgi:hypothetical protein
MRRAFCAAIQMYRFWRCWTKGACNKWFQGEPRSVPWNFRSHLACRSETESRQLRRLLSKCPRDWPQKWTSCKTSLTSPSIGLRRLIMSSGRSQGVYDMRKTTHSPEPGNFGFKLQVTFSDGQQAHVEQVYRPELKSANTRAIKENLRVFLTYHNTNGPRQSI